MPDARRNGFHFDWTFNLGHVILLFGIFGSAFSLFNSLQIKIDENKIHLQYVEQQVKDLAKLVRTIPDINRDLAVIKDRLDREARKP